MQARFLTATLTAATMLLGVTAGAWAQEKTTKIALLAPISSSAAGADAAEMVKGARFAVEEINAKGGVAGYKLELVVADIRDGNPDVVTGVFERLAGDRAINAMVSGYVSKNNFEIELMAEQQMPYIVAGNTAETRRIIARKPSAYPTVWSLMPSNDPLGGALVPTVQQLEQAGKLKPANKKVALISSDYPYSRDIMERMKEAFAAAGWTITSSDLLPFGRIDDWRPFLAKVRRDSPSIIVNTDWMPQNAATFITQFLEQPTNSLVFIQYAPSVKEFRDLTKDKSNGIVYQLLGGIQGNESSPRTAEILGKLKAKYGGEPGPYSVYLYEKVYLYADALAKVGDPTKRLAIGKAIGETDKQVAMGRLKFDPATHLSVEGPDAFQVYFLQLWDGKPTVFYPQTRATGDFRTPPWMK